ncbi:conserved hypothetical protein [uncultured Paludibacter sp.]|uniref:DUF2892 domain-containing protein n=1 Tax=uncultured Paludibacter sp. TaxID=497635 RepID=A0A653AAH8_9BACT|nr:conserved hypothetical protein [uncultured Paludibacter sp.]
MSRIREYLKGWDSARYVKLVFAVILGIIYIFAGDIYYMFFAIFLLMQAVFNFGCGCAGGNCTTSVDKKDKKVSYEIKKLDSNNK